MPYLAYHYLYMDKATEVIRWLQALPGDCEVVWSDDCTAEAAGLSYSFVDCYVPLLVEELGLNWAWSIFPTDEEMAVEEADRRRPRPTSEVVVAQEDTDDREIDEMSLEEAAAELGIVLDEGAAPVPTTTI